MILAIGFVVWRQLAALDGQIAGLTEQTRNLKKSVEQAERKRAVAVAIGEFQKSDISWIDELYRMSRELPSAEEMILTQLTTSTRLPEGGQVVLDGYAQEHDQIFGVGEKLRGPGRQVVSTGGQYDERREAYHWRFKETVLIDPQTGPAEASNEQPPTEKPTPAATAGTKR